VLKLKISALIVILLSLLLTGVFLCSYAIQTDTPLQYKQHHNNIERSVADQRALAALSLKEQADQLANDPQLQQLFKSVREKLAVTPLSELKAMTQNEWNTPVFTHLLAWLQKRESHLASVTRRGKIDPLPSLSDWWGKAPELLLGFAMTPLNDGSTTPILVAHAKEGMGLQGGQSYDFPLLNEVSNSNKSTIGLLAWSKNLYLALAHPVYAEDTLVAIIVLGKELNADFVANFSRNMSLNDSLITYYDPNKGEAAIRYYSARLVEADRAGITNSSFKLADSPAEPPVALSAIAESSVYKTSVGQSHYSVSKSHWISDNNQKLGFYIVSNDSLSQSPSSKLRTRSLILTIILAIIGVFFAFFFITRSQRSVKELSLALWESMNADKAIDYDALKKHADIKSLVLVVEQLILRTTRDENQSPEGESWNELMVNLEDESNELSGEFTRAQLPRFESDLSPEDEALRPLYDEFIQKRVELNITDDMDFEKFLRRVKRNKKQIQDAYNCNDVGFDVVVNAGKVVLKPKILD
jgi:hypothetical protein